MNISKLNHGSIPNSTFLRTTIGYGYGCGLAKCHPNANTLRVSHYGLIPRRSCIRFSGPKESWQPPLLRGPPLSEEQVRLQIEGKLNLPKSQQYLQQEVQNILDVCNQEVREQLDLNTNSRPCLSADLIKAYNAVGPKNLNVEEGVIPGEYRHHSVVVGNVYRGAPAENCAFLVDHLCEGLNGPDFDAPDDELRIPLALVKAIISHVYIAWIHPFGDGNGRTVV